MSLTTSLIAYAAALVTFFILDIIWLGGVAKGMYGSAFGDLLADSPRWGVAIVFYCMYVVGIIFFAVRPAVAADNPILTAAFLGGALGLLCYGTFDLTGLAVLRDFPAKIIPIDMLWGTVLTGSCAVVGTLAATKFS